MSNEFQDPSCITAEAGLDAVNEQAELSNVSLTFREKAELAVNVYKTWAEAHPIVATAAETVVIYGVKRAVCKGAERMGLRAGNGHMPQYIDRAAKQPLQTAFRAVASGPLSEELAFRSDLPRFLDKVLKTDTEQRQQPSRRARGLAVLAFAAAQVGNPFTAKGREQLALPISPLIGGMHYDRLHHKRGLGHAVVGHALNNAMAVAESVPAVVRKRKALTDK